MAMVAVAVAPGIGPASATTVLPTLRSATVTPGAATVSGLIQAPGGPYLYDRHGRVVFFHGVNAVYKYPPFELYPDPGKPWNFSAADASLMARLGFNVVRLGMTWSGLEPGTAPANDPAICDRGAPTDPHQFNQAVFNRYVEHLRETVNLLGRFHIYTILDMHQDVYNEMFDGEGAPNWAVCTNGVPSVDPPGTVVPRVRHQGRRYRLPPLLGQRRAGRSARRVRPGLGRRGPRLQGEPVGPRLRPLQRALLHVADPTRGRALRRAARVLLHRHGAHRRSSHSAPPLRCPKHDPANGVIPAIQANDPSHLIFDEPDNYAEPRLPDLHRADGPTQPRLQHPHLLRGSEPRDRQPDEPGGLRLPGRALSLGRRSQDRPEMASAAQPGGPGWFVTEFGATSSPALLTSITADLDAAEVGWAYWAWKYYGDPTGSAAESLVMADGHLRSTALVLSRTYPQAVAGVPISYDFSPSTGVFHLVYVPDHRVHASTVIFVPTEIHYPHGYCARTSGAKVTSAPGSDHLKVQNDRSGHQVRVVVTPGACPSR